MISREIDLLAKRIQKDFSNIQDFKEYSWPKSALNVIDCVLSLNRNYYGFVKPRVTYFSKERPEIDEIPSLLHLINSYPNPFEFISQELQYRDAARAFTLKGVVEYVISIEGQYDGITEYDRLRKWAVSTTPADYLIVGVKGFGPAGYQYLRMLFGAQTTKPDRHIIKFVSDAIGRPVTDIEAIMLLEEAAKRTGLRLRETDLLILESMASK